MFTRVSVESFGNMIPIMKRWSALSFMIGMAGISSADVMLPKIMGSGMVLQRELRLPSGGGRIRAKR